MGENSQYSSSHDHTWKAVNEGEPFRCNLCGVTGSGFRYQCKPCNFNLHPYCVTCPPTLTSSTNPKHQFKLVNAKTMPAMTYRCKTCSHEIQGIFYHLGHDYSDSDYHPLCATSITVQPQSNPQQSSDTQSRSLYCHPPHPHQVYAPYPAPYYVQNYAPTSIMYIANPPHYYYPSSAPNNCVMYVANPPNYPPNYGPQMHGAYCGFPYGQVSSTSNIGNYDQGVLGNNLCLEEEEQEDEDEDEEGSSFKISNFVQTCLGGVKILLTAMNFVALFL